jgi:hypothetical protein
MRFGAFALLPLGVGILLTVASLACAPNDCSQAVDLMFPAGLVLAFLGVIAFFAPFQFLKPRWLVEAERSGGDEEILRQGATHAPLAVSVGITAVVVVLVGAAIRAGWVTWSLGTALIVLGLSIASLTSWLNRRKG